MRDSRFKWMVVLFLGTVTIFLGAIFLLLWKFTPLVSVDEQNNKVVILGGLVHVKGESKANSLPQRGSQYGAGQNTVDIDTLENDTSKTWEGSKLLEKVTKKLNIDFVKATLLIAHQSKNELSWTCRGNEIRSPSLVEKGDSLSLNLERAGVANCKILIPEKIELKIHGENGRLRILEPKSKLSLELTSGQITLSPHSSTPYLFQIQVDRGYSEPFDSSQMENAIPIQIHLHQGAIIRDY